MSTPKPSSIKEISKGLRVFAEVLLMILLVLLYAENQNIRLIVGMYGHDLPNSFITQGHVLSIARGKMDLCQTEISLVDGYKSMKVDGVFPLTDDTRADRGDTIEW